MPYKDGTEPKPGDTVLGDKFKGVVVRAAKGRPEILLVRVRAPLNPRRPGETGTVVVEKAAAELEAVRRA